MSKLLPPLITGATKHGRPTTNRCLEVNEPPTKQAEQQGWPTKVQRTGGLRRQQITL